MKRLFRNSLYTEQKTDDVRLNQLERRIFSSAPIPAFLRNVSDQSIGSGGALLTWERLYSTKTGIYSTGPPIGTDAPGDSLIYVKQPGLLMIDCTAQWESGTFWRRISINGPGVPKRITNPNLLATRIADALTSLTQNDQDLDGVRAFEWILMDSGDSVSVQGNVALAAPSQNIQQAYLGLVFWPFDGTMNRIY